MKAVDLTGKRFGTLVALKAVEKNKSNHYMWECICDCGKIHKVRGTDLSRGITKSCGCRINAKKQRKPYVKKHGQYKNRIYVIYYNMKNRCTKPSNSGYHNYGGRGITICAEWLNKENGFINFYSWAMANGYKDDLTIERKDNDGNYEPSNCWWIPKEEQQKNRRKNINLSINGEIHNLAEWSKITGINRITLLYRYRKGMRSTDLIKPPIRQKKNNK